MPCGPRFDADEVEAAGDHRLRCAAETEPERLLLALEHAVLVVEAVEVVRHADRVLRDRLRPAFRDRLLGDGRELGEPLDQLALFIATSARRVRGALLGGIVVAVLLFLLQLVVAWFGSHPIE